MNTCISIKDFEELLDLFLFFFNSFIFYFLFYVVEFYDGMYHIYIFMRIVNVMQRM